MWTVANSKEAEWLELSRQLGDSGRDQSGKSWEANSEGHAGHRAGGGGGGASRFGCE